MRTIPASAPQKPSARRSAVVFPAPFGPRRPTQAPSGTEKVTAESAGRLRKCFETPSHSMAAIARKDRGPRGRFKGCRARIISG